MLKLKSTPPNNEPVDIQNLPKLGIFFFFKNWKGYKFNFILLTLFTVIATVAGFAGTWLLAYIINHIAAITIYSLLTVFLPVFLGLVFVREWCGYYTRKYGEMLPVIYTNHLQLRFMNTWLLYTSNKFVNFSKEKLLTYQEKYIAYVNAFLSDWNWGLPRNITLLAIIIGILWYQSPWILLLNVGYMAGFLSISMYLSRKIVKPIRVYHEADNDQHKLKINFLLNLTAIKKLHKNEFFLQVLKKYIQLTNKSMEPVRSVHSKRWFLQLNLFNLIFAITFFYGIYQVIQGQLPIGYILLLQYAFNNLLNILIYFVEYYTGMINQKQDNILFNEEIRNLELLKLPAYKMTNSKFDILQLNGSFEDIVEFDNFKIQHGDKIVIVGPSGSGKSTVVNILLSQVFYKRKVRVGTGGETIFPYLENIAYVNATDPLFDLTLYENICLEAPNHPEPLPEKLVKICVDLGISEFVNVNQFDQPVSKLNLSTGQIQRIKLARALYQDADIYFFDEPFNGIDEKNKSQCIKVIERHLDSFFGDKKTIIFITHNANEIPRGYYNRYEIKDKKLQRLKS